MNIRLVQSWTDSNGITHGPGETVEVDAVTLAELETSGAVARQDQAGEGDTVVTLVDTVVGDQPDEVLNRNGGGGDGSDEPEPPDEPPSDGSGGTPSGGSGGAKSLGVSSAVFQPKGRTGTVIRPTRNGGG